MKNGIINPEDKNPFGFTSDLFSGWLWKKNESIYISMIESLEPGKGNFKRLIGTILTLGFTVKIPTPLGKMKMFVLKNKYKHTIENSKLMGPVDVWVLKHSWVF